MANFSSHACTSNGKGRLVLTQENKKESRMRGCSSGLPMSPNSRQNSLKALSAPCSGDSSSCGLMKVKNVGLRA